MTGSKTGPLTGRRIMVVEDEYLLAAELDSALREAGALVLGPAPTVEAARELLAGDAAPEAAVLDVNVRGEMIYPVSDELAARRIPFVLTSGYDESALPPELARTARLLQKPVETAKLLRALASALA